MGGLPRVPSYPPLCSSTGVEVTSSLQDNDDDTLRHDSLDNAKLRTVLDAFIREGFVELVSFSGEKHEGGQRDAASVPRRASLERGLI